MLENGEGFGQKFFICVPFLINSSSFIITCVIKLFSKLIRFPCLCHKILLQICEDPGEDPADFLPRMTYHLIPLRTLSFHHSKEVLAHLSCNLPYALTAQRIGTLTALPSASPTGGPQPTPGLLLGPFRSPPPHLAPPPHLPHPPHVPPHGHGRLRSDPAPALDHHLPARPRLGPDSPPVRPLELPPPRHSRVAALAGGGRGERGSGEGQKADPGEDGLDADHHAVAPSAAPQWVHFGGRQKMGRWVQSAHGEVRCMEGYRCQSCYN